MLTNKPQPIGLKELISRVKQELLVEEEPKDPLFRISDIELEISFTVERNLNGGVDFLVIQSGVDKTMSEVQSIKVTLKPLIKITGDLTPEQIKTAKNSLTREHNKSRG